MCGFFAMSEESQASRTDSLARVRFGPFELDIRAGELNKNGRKILLQEQPFQILLMLLEKPGDVVLREEIRQRLWPNDTFVQFAPSINAAMQRLREALGDTANRPRYVETVSRRGYRLLGKVETSDNKVALGAEEINFIRSMPTTFVRSKALSSIAVLPLENTRQDPDGDYLSDGITENIINSLSKLSGLRVTPRSTVFRYRRKAMNPQEVGRELEVEAVLAGRVTQRDGALIVSAELIDLRAHNCGESATTVDFPICMQWKKRLRRRYPKACVCSSTVRRAKAGVNASQKTVRRISLICEAATAGTGEHRKTYERGIDIFSKQLRTTPATPWRIQVWRIATAT